MNRVVSLTNLVLYIFCRIGHIYCRIGITGRHDMIKEMKGIRAMWHLILNQTSELNQKSELNSNAPNSHLLFPIVFFLEGRWFQNCTYIQTESGREKKMRNVPLVHWLQRSRRGGGVQCKWMTNLAENKGCKRVCNWGFFFFFFIFIGCVN